MRTTLDLPEKLVSTAMRITREKTKTGLITHALEHLIRRNRIQRLKRFRGKVDLGINLDYLRERK
jgi:Arc/MetJ family transcription regulator